MTLIPPSVEQLKRMRSELDQDPEITKEDLVRLREWLSKQPHLPQHIDDIRLERFLYGCKFSLERTKKILDKYYTVRTGIPEFFGNRDPMERQFQESFRYSYYFPLPRLTPEGYRVTVYKLADHDIATFNIRDITKRIVMVLDARLLEEKCLSNIMVFDLQGFSMAHFAKVTPTLSIVRKAMLSIQDAFPMRLTQIHFVNVPHFIEKVLALFTPLLKEKLVKKFIIHTHPSDSLYEYIPQEILPDEYGGKAGTIAELSESWKIKLESMREWYLEEEIRSKSDESKRQGRMSKRIEDEFGIQGSFRQLAID